MNTKLAKVLSAIALSATLSCCSAGDELAWTEDALLPDGSTITLKRRVEFAGGSSRPGDPSTESKQFVEFNHPITGETIHWENKREQGRLQLIAIWLDEGKPWLLTKPAYGDDDFKYGCPNPPYLLYKHVAGRWIPERLTQIRTKQIRANLTTQPLSARAKIEANHHHLSAQQSADSYAYADGTRKIPYILSFETMPDQTFDSANCDRARDNLFIDKAVK